MKLPLTINELQTGLKEGKYSCVELVDKYLANIRANEDLNAYLTISEELAYEQAKKHDELIKNNPDAFSQLPLLGVVFGLKDLYLTKGLKTTAASKVLEDYIPQYSSTAVERLQEAGAIIIGKTNCDAWAHGASGENSDFGSTKNPWNTNYVPGGSSSGSAVSVACDMSFAAMGTDTGGSIRQPASFTNTVGFKPTYGAVPRYGVVAMASSLDSMGHFTHTVEDSQKIFEVTRGIDHKDGTVAYSEDKISQPSHSPLKIGYAKEYFQGLDSEVEKALDRSKKELEDLGYDFVEISLPHTKYAIAVYYIVQPAEVSSNLNRYDGVRYGNKRDTFGKEAKRRIMLGTYVLSSGYYDAYYLKAMKVRSLIIKDFEKAFEQVDAIFAPVSPTPPFKLGEKTSDPLQMYLSDIFSVSANLAGIPAISIPAGMTQDNLPLSFQLMGKQFGEKVLFEVGINYQKHTDYHTKKPNLN